MLGVDEKTAFEDSCRMEHCISDITFNKLKTHFEEMKK
jgi:Mn-dependent DtxR family transcriptional regulator